MTNVIEVFISKFLPTPKEKPEREKRVSEAREKASMLTQEFDKTIISIGEIGPDFNAEVTQKIKLNR